MSKKKPVKPTPEDLDRQLRELDASWRGMTGYSIDPVGNNINNFPSSEIRKGVSR